MDTAVAKAGGGPLITAWSLTGSQPFVGHGAYSAQIDKVNNGTYDSSTHALKLNVDFTATLMGGTAKASNFDLIGTAYVIKSADFATPSGNAYVDSVLIPLAKTLNATSVFFAQTSGTVPKSSGGSGGNFPAMPLKQAIVGISTQ